MKKFKLAEESQITLSQLMLPSHSNCSGKIHGGYILSLMDQIAFACASKHSGYYCVTASVNKVDFHSPVEVGELITLRASVNFTGKTSMVVGVNVVSENIQTGVKKHCNSSYFTMVAKGESGQIVEIPGLIVETEEALRRYTRSIVRKEEAKKRVSRFSKEGFLKDNFISKLEGQNIKLNL